MAKCDVVEQDQMLMDLSHVADVGYDREAEVAGEQTNADEFRNSRKAGAIRLNDMYCSGLHEVVEQDAIGKHARPMQCRSGRWLPRVVCGQHCRPGEWVLR